MGIGIEQEEMPNNFEIFYRFKSTVNEVDGTGIGLSEARSS